jgi:hypothetical protein
MENTFWTALATNSLAAFVTSAGIYTIRRFSNWGERNTEYFMFFAAGATHLLPKAEQEQKKYSFVALGVGILASIIIVLSKT